jgi:hypothetical protein
MVPISLSYIAPKCFKAWAFCECMVCSGAVQCNVLMRARAGVCVGTPTQGCVNQGCCEAFCATGRGSSSAGFGLAINCIGLIANFSPAKAGFTVGQSSFYCCPMAAQLLPISPGVDPTQEASVGDASLSLHSAPCFALARSPPPPPPQQSVS